MVIHDVRVLGGPGGEIRSPGVNNCSGRERSTRSRGKHSACRYFRRQFAGFQINPHLIILTHCCLRSTHAPRQLQHWLLFRFRFHVELNHDGASSLGSRLCFNA
jgi:hypothetical protein